MLAFENVDHFQQILNHLWSICATLLFVLPSLHHPPAFWIIQIISVEECSSLMQNLMQIRCCTHSVIFFKSLYCCSVTVVCIPPHLSSQPQPNLSPSLASTLPLGFVHVSFIVVPENPSPHHPPLTAPLAIVRLFLISMSLVIFCLLFSFVNYVPVKGEIICYLSLTTWLNFTFLSISL